MKLHISEQCSFLRRKSGLPQLSQYSKDFGALFCWVLVLGHLFEEAGSNTPPGVIPVPAWHLGQMFCFSQLKVSQEKNTALSFLIC